MTKGTAYTATISSEEKVAKASISHLRVHYKHCREITQAIKNKKLEKAVDYLKNVLQYKEAIPFTKYNGGIGRHAQAKQMKVPGDKVAWPQKATKSILSLLQNLKSNAESKGLDSSDMTIIHTNCNQAPKMRRRTYRAHGRINKYESSPAHIQMIAVEGDIEIKKEAEPDVNYSKKQVAIIRAAKAKKIKAGQ